MRIFITAIFIVLNFLMQSTILHYIEIRGVIPNTTIILIVSYALLRGSTEGAIVGFFSGLLQDIFFGTSLGYFTLFNTITGYLFGRGNHNFYRENYLLPMMLCTIAVFLYETMIYLTSFLFRGQLNFLYILSHTHPDLCVTHICFPRFENEVMLICCFGPRVDINFVTLKL